MPINSPLKKILASWTDSPLAGFLRTSDNTQKLDVAVSESVDLVVLNPMAPETYDYIDLTYTGANLTTVVYRNGGPAGIVVSTLTLAYDGSNNLISVIRT